MLQFLLLLTASLVPWSHPCGAEHFFVKRVNETCSQRCHTLDQYAQNASLFEGHTNVSLVFQSGVHNLTFDLSITGVDKLVFSGQDPLDDLGVLIDLQVGTSILVSHVLYFELLNINIRGQVLVNITAPQIHSLVLLNIVTISLRYVKLERIELSVISNGTGTQLTNISECSYDNSMLLFMCDEVQHEVIKIRKSVFSGDSHQENRPAGLTFSCSSQMKATLSLDIVESNFTDWYSGIAFQCQPIEHSQITITDSQFVGNVVGVDVISSLLTELNVTKTQFIDNLIGVGTDISRPSQLDQPSFNNYLLDAFEKYGVVLTDDTESSDLFQLSEPLFTVILSSYASFTRSTADALYDELTSNVERINILDSQFYDCLFGTLIMFWNVDYMAIHKSQVMENYYGIGVGLNRNVAKQILVEDTHFISNQAQGLIFHTATTMNLEINFSTFERNRNTGVYFVDLLVNLLSIQNNTISQNRHGIAAVNSVGRFISNTTFNLTMSTIVINDTRITNNLFGIAAINLSEKQATASSNLVLQNCSVSSNNNSGFLIYNFGGRSTVEDCSFHSNRGNPIIALFSNIELSGETEFNNNLATRGGALSLVYSTVKFANNSNIIFMDNSALEHGGGINVVAAEIAGLEFSRAILIAGEQSLGVNLFQMVPCFYQFDPTNPAGLDITVTFINNTANLGGNNIFGASLFNLCKGHSLNKTQLENIFKFTDASSISSITSDPRRVCFCTDDVNNTVTLCNTTKLVHNEERFPGEVFTILLVLVGYEFGTVTGTVYARVVTKTTPPLQLTSDQNTQTAFYHSCNMLPYSVHSWPGEHVIVMLTAQVSTSDSVDIEAEEENINHLSCMTNPQCNTRLTTPIYMNITLEPCPLGFELNETSFTCVCDDNMNELGVSCEIRDRIGHISRDGSLWIGVDTKHFNTTNTTPNWYLWQRHCLRDYCKNESVSFSLTDPDKQCQFNHAGIFCSQCAAGFSLSLGNNACIECANNYGLLLLLFFIAAGILLIFLLKFLNLTVGSGTINGLVFYANVVWGYQYILFPTPNNHDPLHWILTVPISWINLDFGIKACLYNGLDKFWLALLQFVFPLYIWFLVGLIILVSHFSARATKMFGSNSIVVMATLFLLSYGKLLRNTIIVLTPAELHYSNSNTTLTVWAFEGSLEFGNSIHGILLAIALVVIIFLWLPYTLILLFAPILRSKSHLKPLRWINTLKPFLDAYYGPHNDKLLYQCWTGLLLVTRLILLVTYAGTSSVDPYLSILLLAVIATILLAVSTMSVYKKWYLSLAENLYLLNLILLSCGFLYNPYATSESGYPIVTAVSIALALFQFALLLVVGLIQKCAARRGRTVKNSDKVKDGTELSRHFSTDLNLGLLNSDCEYRDSILQDMSDNSWIG